MLIYLLGQLGHGRNFATGTNTHRVKLCTTLLMVKSVPHHHFVTFWTFLLWFVVLCRSEVRVSERGGKFKCANVARQYMIFKALNFQPEYTS